MSGTKRMDVFEDAVVWQGRPTWRAIACDVFHLRGIAAYLAFLLVLDAGQAWTKAIPFDKALHDSVPLAVIVAGLLAYIVGIAWLTARSTRYTVTTRRVILAYGVAIPATLSIPHGRITRVELARGRGGIGDIALTLTAGDHMPYLKLWPLARPWHLKHPQPLLRGIPQAAIVAGLLTRAVATTAKAAAVERAAGEAATAAMSTAEIAA